MTTQKLVQGSVRILLCSKCGVDFPIFDFEAESDTDVVGLYSAGTCGGEKLLLVDLSLEEWHAVQDGRLRELPSRLSRFAGQGYRMAHVLRIEQPIVPSAGGSFSDFRQLYKAPAVVYSCPCCNGGEALTRSEVTPAEYVESGGQIVAIEPLTLAA